MIKLKQVQQFLIYQASPEVENIEAISKGEWSEAFSYSINEKHFVVRFNKSRENFDRDKRACSFSSERLPVPEILDIGKAFDGFFAISEKIEGEFLDEIKGQRRMKKILPSIFDVFDAMREIDISTTKGFGTWGADGNAKLSSWQEFLSKIKNETEYEWRKKLGESKFGINFFDTSFKKMESLFDKLPSIRHVVHSDLLYFNVFVKEDKISGVIDWGNSFYGDFLYDIAWFSFWAFWHEGLRSFDFRELAREHFEKLRIEVPNFDERMDCYEIHIGLDSLAYISGKERWDQVEDVVKRMEEI
jgi:hygromycin-B 4-O-kinase